MKIEWLGHASMLITTDKGTRLITDPFDGIGIEFPKVDADIVTVSHDHFDHSATGKVGGNPKIINRTGVHEVGDVRIFGYASFHDDTGGQERGNNIIYHLTAGDVRICHLGDLGHQLSKEDARNIGPVDVLFIPVGGTFTLDAAGAKAVAETIGPKIIVPMHYKVPGLSLGISDAGEFLKGYDNVEEKAVLEVKADAIPGTTRVAVLERRK